MKRHPAVRLERVVEYGERLPPPTQDAEAEEVVEVLHLEVRLPRWRHGRGELDLALVLGDTVRHDVRRSSVVGLPARAGLLQAFVVVLFDPPLLLWRIPICRGEDMEDRDAV